MPEASKSKTVPHLLQTSLPTVLCLGAALLLWPFCLAWGIAEAAAPLSRRLSFVPKRARSALAVGYLSLLAAAGVLLLRQLLTAELPALLAALPELRAEARAALSRLLPAVSLPRSAGAGLLSLLRPLLPTRALPELLPALAVMPPAALLAVPRLPQLYARFPALQAWKTRAARRLRSPRRRDVLVNGLAVSFCLLASRLLTLPYPLTFSLLLGMLELLPPLGAGWVLLPVAWCAALNGRQSVCLAAAALYFALLLLRPLRRTKKAPTIRHPLWMLIVGYAGWQLLGLPGALLGVCLAVPLLRRLSPAP